MGFRQAFVKMIEAAGGRGDMAHALAITPSALDNRVYEKGTPPQRVYPDMAIQMQVISNTTLFAEEVARQSGGTFVAIPQLAGEIDNVQIQAKFMHIMEHLGHLAATHLEATKDEDVDADERERLDGIVHQIHRALQELLALTYHLYCKPEVAAVAMPNVAVRKAS